MAQLPARARWPGVETWRCLEGGHVQWPRRSGMDHAAQHEAHRLRVEGRRLDVEPPRVVRLIVVEGVVPIDPDPGKDHSSRIGKLASGRFIDIDRPAQQPQIRLVWPTSALTQFRPGSPPPSNGPPLAASASSAAAMNGAIVLLRLHHWPAPRRQAYQRPSSPTSRSVFGENRKYQTLEPSRALARWTLNSPDFRSADQEDRHGR